METTMVDDGPAHGYLDEQQPLRGYGNAHLDAAAACGRTGAEPSWAAPPEFDAVLADPSIDVLGLVDVDGVLNARRPKWDSRIERRHIRTDAGEYNVTWSPALITELRQLDHHPRVRLVWLTSWGPEVAPLENLWGYLPRWPRAIPELLATAEVPAAKRAVIDRVAAAGRAYVWCDDELAGDVEGTTEHGGPRLEIRPHSKHGLEPVHIERIWGFVTKTIASAHLRTAHPNR